MSNTSNQNESENKSGSEKIWKIFKKILSITWSIITWLFFLVIFGFAIVIFMVRIIDAIANGRSLPEFNPPRRRKPRNFNPEQLRNDIREATGEDILRNFGEQIEEADKKNLLNTEEKKVVRKFRELDRSMLKSQLKDALSNEEIEILFLLILKLLGIEVR